MKLYQQGRPRLDDPAGSFVAGLHPAVASLTLAQLAAKEYGSLAP